MDRARDTEVIKRGIEGRFGLFPLFYTGSSCVVSAISAIARYLRFSSSG